MKRLTIFTVVSVIAMLCLSVTMFGAAASSYSGPENGIPSDAKWISSIQVGGSIIPTDANILDKLEKELGTSSVEVVSTYLAGTTELGSAPSSDVITTDKLEKMLGTDRVEAVSSYLAGGGSSR